MSVFTKIFIVINLFLTLALTGVAGSLSTQRSNHHYANFRNANTELHKTLEELRQERERGADSSKSMADRSVEEQKKAAAEATRFDQLTAEQTKLTANTADRNRTKNEFITKVQRLEKTNNDLNDSVKSLTLQRNEASATRNAATARRAQSDNNLREVKNRIDGIKLVTEEVIARRKVAFTEEAQLKELIQFADKQGVPTVRIAREQIMNVVEEKLEGEVTQVDRDVFLLHISLGDSDKVKEGMAFTVYRGDQYICKAQVKTVGDATSSAWILTDTIVPGRSPQKGDKVKNYD